MRFTYAFAGLATSDLEAALAWYERFLGRPADLVPNDSEAAWQLTETAWVYVVLDPERAGSGLATFLVDDLDRTLAELAARGVQTGTVETIGDGVRRVIVTDADGNRLQLGQPPSTG